MKLTSGSLRSAASGALRLVQRDLSRVGIKRGLYWAFGIMVVLTLFAVSVSLFNFQRTKGQIGAINATSLPAIIGALELAGDASSLAAAAPSLAAADTPARRAAAWEVLERQAHGFKSRMTALRSNQSIDAVILAMLTIMSDEMFRRLRDLNQLVEKRHRANRFRREMVTAIEERHKRLLDQLVPMLDDVNFKIALDVERASRIDGRSYEDFRLLSDALATANLIDAIMLSAANEPRAERLVPLAERFEAATHRLTVIRRDFDSRYLALVRAMGLFSSSGLGANGIFALRKNEIVYDQEVQAKLAATQAFASELSAEFGSLVQITRTKVSRQTSGVHSAISDAEWMIVVIAAISMLIATAIAIFYVGGYLVRRVVALRTSMLSIASGDLTAVIPTEGADEVADMAKALVVLRDTAAEVEEANARAEQTREEAQAARQKEMGVVADQLESGVLNLVETVTAASAQMQTAAEAMSKTAEQTSGEAATAAEFSNRANSNVQTVASAADQMATSLDQISGQVNRSTDITGRAVEQASDTNTTMTSLANAASKIGEIVNLISDIAEQTNLLALNATIEAARAGDAGRGFAVVAAEVKNLAGQTARATEEIAAQIGAIQTETAGAVGAIGEIGGTIREVNEIASAISAAVTEQGAATQEIARNVQDAAKGTGEVTRNIANVSEATADTGVQATQVLTAAEALKAESEALRGQLSEFLTQIRAA